MQINYLTVHLINPPSCLSVAGFAHLGDKDRLELTFSLTKVTHTNDISLRFKTPKENVHLITANNYRNFDLLKVTLDGGIGRVESRFGNAKNVSRDLFLKCNIEIIINNYTYTYKYH